MKLKIVISWAAAVAVCGVLVVLQARQSNADEARMQRIEAKLDSLSVQRHAQDSVNDLVELLDANVNCPQRLDDNGNVIRTQEFHRWMHVDAVREKQKARKATTRFVMRDSSVVLGTWADVQDRVWDIRRAEPIK